MSNTTPTTIPEAGTDVAIVDDVVTSAIQDIASGQALAFSSLTGTDWSTKIAELQAVTNSVPLRDHFNTPIALKDIIIQAVDMVNEQTGVMSKQARTLLLDDEGNVFHSMSSGVLKSIGNIVGILGHPSTWDAPVGVVAKEKPGKIGRYITLELAGTIKLPKK